MAAPAAGTCMASAGTHRQRQRQPTSPLPPRTALLPNGLRVRFVSRRDVAFIYKEVYEQVRQCAATPRLGLPCASVPGATPAPVLGVSLAWAAPTHADIPPPTTTPHPPHTHTPPHPPTHPPTTTTTHTHTPPPLMQRWQACYLRHGITLPPGGTVVDVGGNIGLFSLRAAELMGPQVYGGLTASSSCRPATCGPVLQAGGPGAKGGDGGGRAGRVAVY